MRDSVNGNFSTLTLTITSKPVQQTEPFKPVQDCTLRPDYSNLSVQNNTKNNTPNLSQIIGQMAGAMQYMDPKAAAFRTGLRMMGDFANQLSNQNYNSCKDCSETSDYFNNQNDSDDLLSSLLGFDDDYDYEDENQDNQDIYNLLSSLTSLFGNQSQKNNGCDSHYNSHSQNKKQQQLKSINDLIGGLAGGLSSGVIPPGMSGNVNQLIVQLSNQATCISPMQNPVSGFSPALGLAMMILRK